MDYNNMNYYEILGVDKNASTANITKARNRLKFGSPEDRVPFNKYGVIDQAYDTLVNPELRRKYDETLEKNNNNSTSEVKVESNPIISSDNKQNNVETSEEKSKEEQILSEEAIKEAVSKEEQSSNEEEKKVNNEAYLDKLKLDYSDVISKIRQIYIKNGKESIDYDEWDKSLKEAYKLNDEIKEFSSKSNIKLSIPSVDDILKMFNIDKSLVKKENQEENDKKEEKNLSDEKRDQLHKLVQNYGDLILKIKSIYEKKDSSEKIDYDEWNKSLKEAYKLNDELKDFLSKNDIEIPLLTVDDSLKQYNIDKSLVKKETKEENDKKEEKKLSDEKQNELNRLVQDYENLILKIKSLYEKKDSSEKIDYSDWSNTLQSANKLYNEIKDFSSKNDIEIPVSSVNDSLKKYNIDKSSLKEDDFRKINIYEKIGKKEQPKQDLVQYDFSNLEYHKNAETDIENDYDLAQKYFSSSRKTKNNATKLIFSTIGAGATFFLLGPMMLGTSAFATVVSMLGGGVVFENLWKKIKKHQTKSQKNSFKTDRESYAGVIKDVSTRESNLINKSNEKLKETIEKLCEKRGNNFELEKERLKYENHVKLLGQIIEQRKSTKAKHGEFTSKSLKLDALKKEYSKAKHDLKNINERIERKELENQIGLENVDLSSRIYKNFKFGNAILKLKLQRLKLQKNRNQQDMSIVNEEEKTRNR